MAKLYLTQKTIDELEPLAKADGLSQTEWEKWLEDRVELVKLTQKDLDTRRLKACVDRWSDAKDGLYHPSCCRFPKSCSPHGYIEAVQAGTLTEADLEVNDDSRHSR